MSSSGLQPFTIKPWTSQGSNAFAGIFVPWLKMMTGKEPEPEDIEAVEFPNEFYIRDGGAVFISFVNDRPVGCVAVKKLAPGIYEFGKLVVLDEARGSGLGRALVQRCIDFAIEEGGRQLWLQTFNRLEVAVSMYERMGFARSKPPAQMNLLARTEIVMCLDLPIKPIPGV